MTATKEYLIASKQHDILKRKRVLSANLRVRKTEHNNDSFDSYKAFLIHRDKTKRERRENMSDLKVARLKRNLTQEQLAQMLNLSYTYYQKIELGVNKMTKHVEKLIELVLLAYDVEHQDE